MSNNQSTLNRSSARQWVSNGIAISMLLIFWTSHTQAQDPVAYAKPSEEYIYIYTLDHEYETTLFRSEKFEPILETEDGYIIELKLGGKPKIVLLPFEGQDRKVAEKKYRGVGVTYTAYLTFTEGHLPFDPKQSYEVLRREKGNLLIKYKLNGFEKIIPVPETEFIVRSVFEHQLEESLSEVRKKYRNFEIKESHPSNWQEVSSTQNPGTLTESPTHIARVRNQILATKFHSIRTTQANNLKNVAIEVHIDQRRLIVVPVDYTFETPEQVFYFVTLRGYDRPVLVKDFKQPEDTEGYDRVVRITASNGQDARLLEITDTTNIEFYPHFQFLSPESIVAVRNVSGTQFLIAPDGEYEINKDDIELHTPEGFLSLWSAQTEKDKLGAGDRLFTEFLKFELPPTAQHEQDWKTLGKLQGLAQLYHSVQTQPEASARDKARALTVLETKGIQMGLSLKDIPQRTQFPLQNTCFFKYWKKTFDGVTSQAARDSNQHVLKQQILRSKILIGETNHQALIDFLSNQIYTYSNYLPAPLNRINSLESDPPLAASKLITFKFPLEQSFTLNPASLEEIKLQSPKESVSENNQVKAEFSKLWLLDIDTLDLWNSTMISKMEEVYDPAYRKELEDKTASEKQTRIEIARKRLQEAQAAQLEHTSQLKDSKLPWIAVGVWFIILLITNSGFFALSKVMPIRQS